MNKKQQSALAQSKGYVKSEYISNQKGKVEYIQENKNKDENERN